MPLEPDVLEKAKQWLEEKGPGADGYCPFCGRSNWGIGSDLIAAPVVNSQGITQEGYAPFLFLVCQHCGHVLFFSAMHLGLPSPETSAEVQST